MQANFIKPDPNCPACHGTGEVWLPVQSKMDGVGDEEYKRAALLNASPDLIAEIKRLEAALAAEREARQRAEADCAALREVLAETLGGAAWASCQYRESEDADQGNGVPRPSVPEGGGWGNAQINPSFGCSVRCPRV